MLPFATLAQGTAVSVVMSWRSGVNYLVMCGAVGFLSVALVLAWWVRALIVLIPRPSLRLIEKHADRGSDEGDRCSDDRSRLGRRQSFVARTHTIIEWLVEATHEWLLTPSAGDIDAIGDTGEDIFLILD